MSADKCRDFNKKMWRITLRATSDSSEGEIQASSKQNKRWEQVSGQLPQQALAVLSKDISEGMQLGSAYFKHKLLQDMHYSVSMQPCCESRALQAQ